MKKFPLLSLSIAALLLCGCSPKPESKVVASKAEQTEPLKFPEIYTDYLNRDIRDDMFYFVLPDRFNNANPDNDNGSKDVAISRGGFDPGSKWHFHGGDIQGVEQKLDYLHGLGVSAIWMTPILRNRAMQGSSSASHGYWILDFTQIDPHFGSNDDLKHLIQAAHEKGIKVFFDIITNHTADVIKYRECHNPDGSFAAGQDGCAYKSTEQLAAGDTYTPFIPEGDENLKSPAWLNDPKYYNNQGDSFWQGESSINGDFVGLDDLNTLDPQVVSGFIDIYKNIITEFKPDGFRIDTVKHVDMSFWQAFSPAIVEHAKSLGIPNFHVFGEVYDGSPEVLSSFTTIGKLPSVLDFGFQHAAAEVFYRGKNPGVIKTLFENDDYYADHDSQADILMNFLGNHDMGRSGFFINQAMENADPEEKLRRSILSHGFMYLSRGVPVIYYGDEQGFTGDGGDVAAREDMFASRVDEYNDNTLFGTDATTAQDNFNQLHPIYLAIKDLAQLRMDHPALRRGLTFSRYFDDNNNVFALSRVEKEEQKEYLIVFNADTQPQEIELDAASSEYQHVFGEKQFDVLAGKVTVKLPALSFSVLKGSDTLDAVTDLNTNVDGIMQLEDRIKIHYKVAGAEQKTLPILSVKTEIELEGGQYTLLSEDFAPPYSAIIDKHRLMALNGLSLKVTTTNSIGQSVSNRFPIPDM